MTRNALEDDVVESGLSSRVRGFADRKRVAARHRRGPRRVPKPRKERNPFRRRLLRTPFHSFVETFCCESRRKRRAGGDARVGEATRVVSARKTGNRARTRGRDGGKRSAREG